MFDFFKKKKEENNVDSFEQYLGDLGKIVYHHFKREPLEPLYVKYRHKDSTNDDWTFARITSSILGTSVFIDLAKNTYLKDGNFDSIEWNVVNTHGTSFANFEDNFSEYEYHFVNKDEIVEYMNEYTRKVNEKFHNLRVNGIYSVANNDGPMDQCFFVKILKKIIIDDNDYYFEAAFSDCSKNFTNHMTYKVTNSLINRLIPAKKVKIIDR